MSHDIARDVYNALIVPTATPDGTLPPAFGSPHSRTKPPAYTSAPLDPPSAPHTAAASEAAAAHAGTAAVLHAVAALCVCAPRHQRVAVSLVHARDGLALHVAQTGGAGAAHAIHGAVRDVWALLGQFAAAIGRPDARSPAARAAGHEAQRRILERLVRHGVLRLRHRVLKHWGMFQGVCLRLQTEKVKHGKVYKYFCAVAARLTELRQALSAPEPVDWGTQIAPHLGRLYMAEQKLAGRGLGDLHMFLAQFTGPDEAHALALRLSKYFSKCTSLVGNANTVMKLASYRYQSPIFNTPSFEVKLVSCRTERQPRAGSLFFWKRLLHKSVLAQDPESLVSYQLHPECALLEYHHNTLHSSPWTATPDTPSHQLGTSKEPCHACRTFFAAYHACRADTSHDPPHYYPLHLRLPATQGETPSTHSGNWLPPRLWGIGEDVESKFASQLLEEYRYYRTAAQWQEGSPYPNVVHV